MNPTRTCLMVLVALALVGCAAPAEEPAGATPAPSAPAGAPSPAPTPAACEGGAARTATRFAFTYAYVEQDPPYDGAAGRASVSEHQIRSWTDMRLVAFRDAGPTGEPGIEVVTIDATNGTATWRLEVRYETQSRCVANRDAENERLCAHWSAQAEAFRARFDEAGGWSATAQAPCGATGGDSR